MKNLNYALFVLWVERVHPSFFFIVGILNALAITAGATALIWAVVAWTARVPSIFGAAAILIYFARKGYTNYVVNDYISS